MDSIKKVVYLYQQNNQTINLIYTNMKYYTNPKHQERPTEKVNLQDVILLLSFTFIFVLPFINALIKTNF